MRLRQAALAVFLMLDWRSFDRVYIRPGRTDMRKAINGLVAMILPIKNSFILWLFHAYFIRFFLRWEHSGSTLRQLGLVNL